MTPEAAGANTAQQAHAGRQAHAGQQAHAGRSRSETSDRWLVAAALVVWTIAAVIYLAIDPPLGPDEAEYALGAQALWAGERPVWLYTSVGTELLALPGVVLGGGELGLRLASTVASLATPIGAYVLARAVFADRRVAAWTVAILATDHQMAIRNATLQTDLPATGLVLFALAILVRELGRPSGPSWRIVGAAPLLAAAFYVRYGSLPVLVIVAVAAIAFHPRSIARRPLPVLGVCAAAAVAAIPHFAASVHHTGELFGVFHEASTAPRAELGLVEYVTSNPFMYYGFVVAPLALAGIAAGIVWRGAPRMLVAVALGQVVTLGVLVMAQPRYLFIAVALLVILGVAGALRVYDRVHQRRAAATAVLGVVIAAWLGCIAGTFGLARRLVVARAVFVELGDRIRADARGAPCVVIAGHEAQIAYYSGCAGYHYPSDAPPPADRLRYVVSIPRYELDVGRVAQQWGTPRELTPPDLRVVALPP